MLDTSYADYKLWRSTGKPARLRDAANKLIAVAENLTANKADREIGNWGEFRHYFLREYRNNELFLKLASLHKFFYEGLGYDETMKDIEYTYGKARKEMKGLVKNFDYQERLRA